LEGETEPEIINHAGERSIFYKGKEQKFYLYKVGFADDTESYYLGVAGPYPVNAKDFTSTHSITGIYWDSEFDSKALDKQLKEYLALWEED